jgi:hypothetical protein
MSNEMKKIYRRKQSWPTARYYSDNYLQRLRKTVKDISQDVGITIVLRKLILSIYGSKALVALGRFFSF